MNCQEFRSKWNHSADDAVFTHIETCDDCLNWIEKSANTVEEAMFLKEYPTPSVELEERIMQAIYSTASTNVPLTATVLPAAGDVLVEKPNKRRFFIPTWVAAAGVVIAVGLIGGPLLTGTHSDQFAENAAAPAASPAQQANTTSSTAAPSTGGNSGGNTLASPDSSVQAAPGTEQPSAEIAAAQPGSSPQGSAVAKQADAHVVPFQAASSAPAASTPQASSRVTIPDRSKHELKSQPPALPNADVAASEAPSEQPATHTTETSIAAVAPDTEAGPQNLLSAFGGNEETTDAQKNATEQPQTALPEGAVGKMALTPENPITISTFSDIDTAVQASDLPVPSLSKPPADYTLGTLTVQYESQTSKHVSSLRTSYHQASTGKQITVDVTPNPQRKRSLSVPGEFSSTQVFQIDGEQAIGVTYKENADAGTVKSAVHYQTTKGNQSVYVVVSADGIPLSELMELAKQVSWKMK